MKKIISALLLIAFVLGCVNFPLVSYADSYVYTINGERCVFLSNSATVSYGGGEYSTYTGIASALSALGSQGGKVIICGDFKPSDNSNDGAFVDPAGRGPVTFTGATGADTDSLTQNGTLDFKQGNVTFDNFTLKMGTTKYFSAPNSKFTSNFAVNTSSGALFYTGALSGNFSTLATEISGGEYGQMNIAGMGNVTLGSSSAPGNARITINGGKINCALNMGSGYSNSNVYGNTYYVVNGGNFTGKSVVANKMNHNSGRKIVIFNNGMAEGFTVANGIVAVKSTSGGTAVIDDATASDVNPKILLIPNGDLFPIVNGEAPKLDDNGKYYISVDGTATAYEVSWEKDAAGVYVVDGIRTVFLANTQTVTYNGNEYTAFSSINEALALIGKRSGRLLVNGAFVPTEFSDLNAGDAVLDTIFKDPERGTVTITGATGADVDSFGIGGTLKFSSGKVIFDDISLKMLKNKYFAGSDLVFTEKVRVIGNNTMLFTGAVDGKYEKIEAVLKGGTVAQLNIAGMENVSLGNSSTLGYGIITLDGVTVNANFNFGSGYSPSNINGNLYYVVNSGNFTNKNVVANKITHVSGRKFVIFNNGLSDGFTVVDGVTVIDTANGGMATVADGTHALSCPTIVLTPDAGRTPVVDGVELTATDGVYSFKPEETKKYTVTWASTEPQKYVIDGENVVFLTDGGPAVFYNDKKYYAYNDITKAVASLGTDGGKLIICDTFSFTEFSDVKNRGELTVTGINKEAKIVISEASNSAFVFNGGKTVFDDIEVYVASGAGRYIHGGGHITFTENFRSNSALYLSPVLSVTADSADMYVYAGNYATVDANGSNATIGTAEKPGHIALHLEGGTFNRINGGWGWAAKNLYGNIFIYVNKAYVKNDVSYTPGATISGTRNIIFNNKRYIKGGGVEINVDPAFDHVIFSDNGGLVTVENEDTTETPTFILTPEGENIPFVNGEKIEAVGGVYKYTPTEKGKVYVTWRYPVTVSFDANGGTGKVPSAMTEFSAGTYELPKEPDIEKYGCIFIGWNTDKDAEEGFYSMTFDGNETLYAIWLEKLPIKAENANLEANGIANVEFEHLEKDAIASSVDDAKLDAVFCGTAEYAYAFSVSADDGENEVKDFVHGIDLVIPDYAYSHIILPGEFLRLYKAVDGKSEFVCTLEEKDGALPITVYSAGSYFVMLNTPDTAEYIYSVYEKNGKVLVDMFFSGAVANSGFFGLCYNSDVLSLEGFEYSDGISTIGTDANGGYGCFKNEDGIYADAWLSSDSIDASAQRELIGTFTFEKTNDGEYGFTYAEASEYGADEVAGYPAGAQSAYFPYIESTEAILQPAFFTVENKKAAYIGNEGFDSLSDALTAAENGDTVKLEADITLAEDIAIPAGVTVYITENASVKGAKLDITSGAKVVSEKQVYGDITADTLVGMAKDGALYSYVASAYSKDTVSLYGVQIRTTETQGLRFIADIKGNKEDTYKDYGLLIIPTDLSDKENTTHETAQVGEISKSGLGDGFKYFEEADGSFKYTICIVKMRLSNYGRDFTARPFFRYDADGVEYTVYADYDEKFDLSVVDVAKGLIDEGIGDTDALQKIIDDYNEYLGK